MKTETGAGQLDLDDPVSAALCLALTPGIGPVNYRTLVAALGSPRSVLAASPEQLRTVPGIGAKLTRSLVTATQTVDISGELQRCREHSIELLSCDAARYPRRLTEIADAPAMLFCRGSIRPMDDLAIAIVGTRHATSYGNRQAERFARGLALAGFTIISGMARGIDAAAHRGALGAGGRTIAVLGSGLLNLYPPEHAELSLEIAENGAVISEYPTMQSPKSGAFPQRNRIVTGLSLGVIIIEAADRSGALISARHAGEQGREVFALPGQVDSRMSSGCHQLIRDGATLVTSVDDILEGLGPLGTPMTALNPDGESRQLHHPAELQLNEQEQVVLQAIGVEPTEVDDIVFGSGLPIHRVLSTLSVLEMRRLVRRVSGTRFCRN
jgi:DNA processing protein